MTEVAWHVQPTRRLRHENWLAIAALLSLTFIFIFAGLLFNRLGIWIGLSAGAAIFLYGAVWMGIQGRRSIPEKVGITEAGLILAFKDGNRRPVPWTKIINTEGIFRITLDEMGRQSVLLYLDERERKAEAYIADETAIKVRREYFDHQETTSTPYIGRPRSSEVHPQTEEASSKRVPDWVQDGLRFVYESDRKGEREENEFRIRRSSEGHLLVEFQSMDALFPPIVDSIESFLTIHHGELFVIDGESNTMRIFQKEFRFIGVKDITLPPGKYSCRGFHSKGSEECWCNEKLKLMRPRGRGKCPFCWGKGSRHLVFKCAECGGTGMHGYCGGKGECVWDTYLWYERRTGILLLMERLKNGENELTERLMHIEPENVIGRE